MAFAVITTESIGLMMMRQLANKTFLLGIGAQRCGTTWMHDYLSEHPEVYGSLLKEMHFFDTHLNVQARNRWLAKFEHSLSALQSRPSCPLRDDRVRALQERMRMHDDPCRYISFFADRVQNERVVCEITPSYSLLDKEQFRWIRDLISKSGATIKILFLMRDPVDRHQSFLQYRRRQQSGQRNFVRSLSQELAVARGRYDLTLENIRSVFKPEQIVVGFYEHIFADPDLHLRQLANQIGIDYIQPSTRERKNAAPRTGEQLSDSELAAGLATFAPVYEYVNREFSSSKPSNWRA